MKKLFNFLKPKKKVGLVLGGGASKGAAIFGIIEELERLNLKISYVSGTSVGAIIGAYYALYGEINSLKEEVFEFTKKDWMKFADFNKIPKMSLIKADYYKKFLEKKFGDKKFSDTKIPLIITTTNLDTGKAEYIEKGKIVDAIIASSAYPGVFPPVRKNENIYVDGGVLDNLPYKPLLEKNLSKIVVINLYGKIGKRNIKNVFGIVINSIDLMIGNAFNGFENENQKLFFIQPKFKKNMGSLWNFSDLDKKYDAGVEEFEKRKKNLLDWLKF